MEWNGKETVKIKWMRIYQIRSTFGSNCFVTSESNYQHDTNGDTEDHAAEESHFHKILIKSLTLIANLETASLRFYSQYCSAEAWFHFSHHVCWNNVIVKRERKRLCLLLIS